MADMTLEEALAAATVDEELVTPVNEVLLINPETRTINVPDSEKLFGARQDMDVERKYFKCPRIVGDNIDLFEHEIFVNYVPSKQDGSYDAKEDVQSYWCKDLAVEGDFVTFSWKLSENVTRSAGYIAFAVYAKTIDEYGNLQTKWHTTIAIGNVLDTLPDGEELATVYPDIVMQLLERMDEVEKNGGNGTSDAVQYIEQTLTEEQKTQARNNIGAANSEEVSKLSEEIANIGKPTDEQVKSAVNDYLDENGVVLPTTVEPADDDIPKVFFSEAIPQTKDDATTAFRYISKTKDISGYAEFKAQGNSSMSYPKKNMTVKMYSDDTLSEKLKVNFKEWGEQAKHVYKANWIDLTHSRNIVSARLWADVVKSRENYLELPELLRTSPNQGAVDGFPVKVYSQGIYQGRYTLNIPKDAWMSNMDDSLDNHCILCGENYASGCFRATANINGSDWSDEVHDTVPTSIKKRWNEVISFVMNSTDEEFVENLENYFFVDSLIDYFIFGMVSCGLDAFGKNQIYMTYDGVRWIASMYDMDSTWGLYWDGSKFVSASYARTEFEDFVHTDGNLLYVRLAQLFYKQIQLRYDELKNGALSVPNIINRFERFTDIASLDLVKEDYASTTGGGKFTRIPSKDTNNIQQIRKFVIDRFAYCDEYFASLVPTIPIPATSITLDKSSLTFTDASTQTITATVEPSDTTDAIVWSSDNEEVAKVENGVVTPIAKGSCTITVNCGSVSANCSVTVDIEDIVTYTITRNLTGCTSSSTITSINEGTTHTETITVNNWYLTEGATISITMGGVDVSSGFIDGVLTINSVTGNIVISITYPINPNAPLYPLENGSKNDGNATGTIVSVSNGNHVKIETAWEQIRYPCVTNIGSVIDFKNNTYGVPIFDIPSDAVVKMALKNVTYEIDKDNQYAIWLEEADGTEHKVITNNFKPSDKDMESTITFENGFTVTAIKMWGLTWIGTIEFDIELYVNDVRYI